MGFQKQRRPTLSEPERRSIRSVTDVAATMVLPSDDDGAILTYTAPLTAARAVALSTAGAVEGMRWRVVRDATATGAFALNVGTGPLKNLAAAGDWCDVAYDGAAWVLVATGAL